MSILPNSCCISAVGGSTTHEIFLPLVRIEAELVRPIISRDADSLRVVFAAAGTAVDVIVRHRGNRAAMQALLAGPGERARIESASEAVESQLSACLPSSARVQCARVVCGSTSEHCVRASCASHSFRASTRRGHVCTL